jgi:hypothetical protein
MTKETLMLDFFKSSKGSLIYYLDNKAKDSFDVLNKENKFKVWVLPDNTMFRWDFKKGELHEYSTRDLENYKSSLQSELNRLNNILKNTKDRT